MACLATYDSDEQEERRLLLAKVLDTDSSTCTVLARKGVAEQIPTIPVVNDARTLGTEKVEMKVNRLIYRTCTLCYSTLAFAFRASLFDGQLRHSTIDNHLALTVGLL